MLNEHWKKIEAEFDKNKMIINHSMIRCHFLYLEDRRYFNHGGIDYLRSLRALSKYIIGIRTGGASTIEQQLVRTITQNYQTYFSHQCKRFL